MNNSNFDFVHKLWATELISDHTDNSTKRVLKEVLHDLAPKHNLKQQTEIHEKIRNDEDYDDWNYGTEPSYGKMI